MTQTANCARHLGVIVGKMLPNHPPQIYTPVAKEAILLQPQSLSNPNQSHLSQRSYLQNLNRIAFYTKNQDEPE